jgi:hypothetical protein
MSNAEAKSFSSDLSVTSQAATGVLSEECEKRLYDSDMWSEPAPHQPGFAHIRDEEGNRLFTVTLGIDTCDLQAIIAYGMKRYVAGEEWGVKKIQTAMRSLLGAAAKDAS